MEFEISDLVCVHGKKIQTDSLIVAEKFGKKPKNVNRKIESLLKSDESNGLTFEPVTYVDSKGEERKMYKMNRKSFSILVMGFSGKRALQWKIKFYDAFEAMEKILLRQMNESWRASRIEGKGCRSDLTDSIKKIVDLAETQGSKNGHRYYTTFTKLIYSKLFGLKKVPDNFRDSLDGAALKRLRIVETQVSLWIDDVVGSISDYHDVYQLVKEKIDSLVLLVGDSDQQEMITAA